MANHKYLTAPEPIQLSAPAVREMVVTILARDYVQWEGTAEQLRGEGLIPDGTEWPGKRDSRHWVNGKFSYWLRRTRPPGIKGPMSVWVNGDYWMVRVSLTAQGAKSWSNAQVYEARCAYIDALWRQTPAYSIQCNRGWRASQDHHFQAFMAKAKGLPASA